MALSRKLKPQQKQHFTALSNLWHAHWFTTSKRTPKVGNVQTLILLIMKKLLLAVLFLGGITAQANAVTDLDHTTERGIRYNQPQSITFVERGVKFVVFTNGQFDFASLSNQVQTSGRRGQGYYAPGHSYGVTYSYSSRDFVKRNRYGDVYKVGRNYVDYNRYGHVDQIGSVNLRYRNGQLVRVGDMKIIYNRRGYIVDLVGYVHHDHTACGVCGVTGCSTNHFDYNGGNYHTWDYRRSDLNWTHHNQNTNSTRNRSRGHRN